MVFYPFLRHLRAVPPFLDSQIWGVLAMGLAVVILFALPWLDYSPVKSIRYRGILYKSALALFVITFVALGALGVLAPTPVRQALAQFLTVMYFAFFFLMPWYTAKDKTVSPPARVG